LVAILVRLRICEDSASKLGLEVTEGVRFGVFNGFASFSPGNCIVCRANMVADGGVFSPKIGFER
jgi:hypothetical protein